jgi:hypothetical protein
MTRSGSVCLSSCTFHRYVSIFQGFSCCTGSFLTKSERTRSALVDGDNRHTHVTVYISSPDSTRLFLSFCLKGEGRAGTMGKEHFRPFALCGPFANDTNFTLPRGRRRIQLFNPSLSICCIIIMTKPSS